MKEILQDHHTYITIIDRPIFNLRFADDIDRMGGTSDDPKTPRPHMHYMKGQENTRWK
ncbi:hypothetical protein DPMN_040477 [Dreissena polymorpha]|uniref:Uncharacterized protein n=1 Tax=Dreissena polymorpha TaxID=45954 RepID=A0A9D4CV40_DREPO|nr:hypothetical protein DPMN_040477 [Dreissena polymorpha]